jgi:hypothetical protein
VSLLTGVVDEEHPMPERIHKSPVVLVGGESVVEGGGLDCGGSLVVGGPLVEGEGEASVDEGVGVDEMIHKPPTPRTQS